MKRWKVGRYARHNWIAVEFSFSLLPEGKGMIATSPMKTKLFLLVAMALLSGCAAPPPQRTKAASRKGDISNEEAEKPPFIGMTKAQALARYGDPKKQTITDEGEQWTYILNFGEVIGRAMIPFNFKPTLVRTGVLIFGPDGRVKKFNWDAPTEG